MTTTNGAARRCLWRVVWTFHDVENPSEKARAVAAGFRCVLSVRSLSLHAGSGNRTVVIRSTLEADDACSAIEGVAKAIETLLAAANETASPSVVAVALPLKTDPSQLDLPWTVR